MIFQHVFLLLNLGFIAQHVGATRAFISLCKGDIFLSIYYNPIVSYCITTVIGYLIFYVIIKLKNKSDEIMNKYAKSCFYIGITIIIINCILRNILLNIYNIKIG